MQRKYAWIFGAVGEALALDRQSQLPLENAALDHLAAVPDGDSAPMTPLCDGPRRAILGAKLSRSGSWNRASSGS